MVKGVSRMLLEISHNGAVARLGNQAKILNAESFATVLLPIHGVSVSMISELKMSTN
jgi:hypothetical protein